jgi:hypothetical protein
MFLVCVYFQMEPFSLDLSRTSSHPFILSFSLNLEYSTAQSILQRHMEYFCQCIAASVNMPLYCSNSQYLAHIARIMVRGKARLTGRLTYWLSCLMDTTDFERSIPFSANRPVTFCGAGSPI